MRKQVLRANRVSKKSIVQGSEAITTLDTLKTIAEGTQWVLTMKSTKVIAEDTHNKGTTQTLLRLLHRRIKCPISTLMDLIMSQRLTHLTIPSLTRCLLSKNAPIHVLQACWDPRIRRKNARKGKSDHKTNSLSLTQTYLIGLTCF